MKWLIYGSKEIQVSNIIYAPIFDPLVTKIHGLESHELGLVNSIIFWQGHKGRVHYQNVVLSLTMRHFILPSRHLVT